MLCILRPTLPFVNALGAIRATGGAVAIPFTDDPTITLTAPFTSSFVFGFFATDFQFGFQFIGSGTATLVAHRVGISLEGNPTFLFELLTYTFAEPVPEPTTFVLLGTGLAGIGLRVIKKRYSVGRTREL